MEDILKHVLNEDKSIKMAKCCAGIIIEKCVFIQHWRSAVSWFKTFGTGSIKILYSEI